MPTWSARGAQFLTPPKQYQYEIRCYIRDPDGHLIEVDRRARAARPDDTVRASAKVRPMTTWRTGRAACVAALSLAAIWRSAAAAAAAPPPARAATSSRSTSTITASPGSGWPTAPNIKGLIARGTLAFTRVVVPTHSNQNNMSLLTGQYPDGNNVPANDWLARDNGFVSPVSVAGELNVGDYAALGQEPAARARRQRLRRDARGRRPLGLRRRAAAVRGGRRRRPPVDRRHHVRDAARAADRGRDDGEEPAHQLARLPAERRRQLHLRRPARQRRDADPVHAARRRRLPSATTRCRRSCSSGTSSRSTTIRPACTAPTARRSRRSSRTTTPASASCSPRSTDKNLLDSTNILFTLDHGKVDTHNQVVLGTQGGANADGQLAALVTAQGAAMGLDTSQLRAPQRGRRRADLRRRPRRRHRRRRGGAGRRHPQAAHADPVGRHHRARHDAHADRRRRARHAQLPRLPRRQPQPGRHRRLPEGRLDAEPGRRHQHRRPARSRSTRSTPTAGTAASPPTSSTSRSSWPGRRSRAA